MDVHRQFYFFISWFLIDPILIKLHLQEMSMTVWLLMNIGLSSHRV